MAGVFECLPSALKKVTMLWVEHRRIAFAEAEKIGIEHFHIGQNQAGAHIVGVLQLFVADARRAQLVVAHPLRGFLASYKKRPQL